MRKLLASIVIFFACVTIMQFSYLQVSEYGYKKGFEAGRIFERELLLNADSSKVNCLFGYIPDSLYKMNLPELRDSGSYKIRGK